MLRTVKNLNREMNAGITRSRRNGATVKRVALTAFLAAIALVFVFPLVFTLSNSLMKDTEIQEHYSSVYSNFYTNKAGLAASPKFAGIRLIPDEVSFGQYYTVLFKRTQFLYMFWNSAFLAVSIVIGQLAVASTAAFAFAKLEFKHREPIFFIYILTMLMPFQVTLVPNFIISDLLGLLGRYSSIILPGIFGTFGVFLLRQFMTYIPDEYCESARVDGAALWKIFISIILPMTKSGIAALGILLFIDNWNMVEQPLIFLQGVARMPLSVYLSSINSDEMGIAFAASCIYMIPVLLVFAYGEDYLLEGIELSGIKG